MAKPVSTEVQRQTGNTYYRAGFLRAGIGFFANYVNFTGRSSRSEYWWVALWRLLIAVLFVAAAWLILGVDEGIVKLFSGDMPRLASLIAWLLILILYGLASIVPALALEVRRFRDAGWSWWWMVGFYGTASLGGILVSTGELNNQPWGYAIGTALIVVTAIFELVIDLLPTKNPPVAGNHAN
ncbi:DUF805 domain-containing protein [Lacticaseibacillus hegangensis]|uniref:DUF805 domain-containing protein n=1 Tax=Lacticaseibacillus hegangensis TaxID=2486010 RepID=A0ABW4CZE3_9LACO|nr:DUF805 domain-containing protein [Lacticaseibacillus hegangensis]